MKIMLDPGHSSNLSPGAGGNGIREEEYVLKLALAVGKKLKSHGIDVQYTRTTNNAVSGNNGSQDLNARCKRANQIGVDYFISIHNNCADSPQANGAEVLYNNRFAQSKDLAQAIQNKLVAIGYRDRGLKIRNDLCVLNQTSMPACLIEVGFLSNKGDAEMLKDNTQEVDAIVNGILSYLNIEETPTKPIRINGELKPIETVTRTVNGGDVNYMKLRDLANHSNGHMIVGYENGEITITFK